MSGRAADFLVYDEAQEIPQDFNISYRGEYYPIYEDDGGMSSNYYKKISVVIPVMNQFPLFYATIREMINNLDRSDESFFLIIDNGSDVPLTSDMVYQNAFSDVDSEYWKNVSFKIIRNEKSNGVYPTFWQGMENIPASPYHRVVCFFHSDMVIWEKGWNKKVLESFEQKGFAMAGFIGSNEIDSAGGRGLGTASKFMGRSLHWKGPDGRIGGIWHGSAASVHGRVLERPESAAVVDGCSIIFDKRFFANIPMIAGFPPHHFYDRLFSTQFLERGYSIGILPIECDHISGQTVNQEPKYHEMAKDWCEKNDIPFDGSWDQTVYKQAEKVWMSMAKPRFIPFRV